MTKFLLGALFLLSINNAYSADPLAQPVGPIVFSVTGNIEKKNSDQGALFDLPMLLAFEQSKITTSTPWTDGQSKFEGLLIRDLMTYLGATGTEIIATALNGYRIVLPYQDIIDHSVILAIKQDDSILSVRKRGPSWVIYPWDDDVKLQNSQYYMRSIWQLKGLEVK